MNWTLQLFFFLESINAFDIKKEEKKPQSETVSTSENRKKCTWWM